MKKYLLTAWLVLVLSGSVLAATLKTANKLATNFFTDEYSTSVTFPGGYVIGDYIEFLKVSPISAGSSGYYHISISYTRGNVAAAATHVASISHYNPSIWRETGRINNNGYINQGQNFTIDCNTEYAKPRFRIRAINTLGTGEALTVSIKVSSINFNGTYTSLNTIGNDRTVDKLLAMTNEWDLYVGNPIYADGASIAIKALANGNVGIGTALPTEKLSVNGNIRAKEIKVETANWPDYVFKGNYELTSLAELEKYIKAHNRLPEMPSAKEAESNGISLGEMNKLLLKKIEELSLHLIKKDKEIIKLQELSGQVMEMKKKLSQLMEINQQRNKP